MDETEFAIPDEAVLDACKLLGVGEWETSHFRGSPDFATVLERKYPVKVWRAAVKRAMALADALAKRHVAECDAREAAGLPRHGLTDGPVQGSLEFKDVKKPGSPVKGAGQKPRIATRPI